MYLDIEDNKSGWKKIQSSEGIDLGEYKNISGPEDWIKGVEKAVAVMLERIDATDSSRENAKRIVDKVKENQAKFSGKSRFSIAAAVVYFAIEDEADMKEIIKVGSISPASLKNMIETMESRINLN